MVFTFQSVVILALMLIIIWIDKAATKRVNRAESDLEACQKERQKLKQRCDDLNKECSGLNIELTQAKAAFIEENSRSNDARRVDIMSR